MVVVRLTDPLLLSDPWVIAECRLSGSRAVRFSGGVPDPLLLPDPWVIAECRLSGSRAVRFSGCSLRSCAALHLRVFFALCGLLVAMVVVRLSDPLLLSDLWVIAEGRLSGSWAVLSTFLISVWYIPHHVLNVWLHIPTSDIDFLPLVVNLYSQKRISNNNYHKPCLLFPWKRQGTHI